MAWSSLSDRWSSLPTVIAGPILRRVEAASVTVWVVTRTRQSVALSVFDADGPAVLMGQRDTVALGPGCHVVAVTARPVEGSSGLVPGHRYHYNMWFNTGSTLHTPGIIAPVYALAGQGQSVLGYGSDDALPSFSLPPADLAQLRILHGSCRRPQGDDRDALEGLDDLIRDSAADANRRPHHLFLTGDQIYGDNVAEALLHEIIHANPVLFGVQETVLGANQTADLLFPGSRGDIMRNYAGQPMADETYKRSHLLTLTEFISMYLFTWSEILWPPTGGWAPQLDARGGVPAPHSNGIAVKLGIATNIATDYDDCVIKLELYRSSLSKIRRGLANVPTYMTFDDHDFTDSWGVNYQWMTQVLQSPYGAKHMRNALTAYAICQGWGNRPADFEPGGGGAELLSAAVMSIANGGLELSSEATLATRVGPNAPLAKGDGTYALDATAPDAGDALGLLAGVSDTSDHQPRQPDPVRLPG